MLWLNLQWGVNALEHNLLSLIQIISSQEYLPMWDSMDTLCTTAVVCSVGEGEKGAFLQIYAVVSDLHCIRLYWDILCHMG